MRLFTPLLLLAPALLFLLSACSTQAWYEGMKASARQQCSTLPPGAYEDCMRRVTPQSYDQYEQERERLRKEND